MFPLWDENPSFLTPMGTYLLVALNLVSWVLVQGMGAEPTLTKSVCEYGLIPGEILHRLPVGTHVALNGQLSCVVGYGASWLTPLSSMFMHGGWLHIAGNMWFLWIFWEQRGSIP